MNKITTTIKREWLREIAAGRKRIEYREIKPYWTLKLKDAEAPFLLRLINGMQSRAPEVTVVVKRVRRNETLVWRRAWWGETGCGEVLQNTRSGNFELHIGRVVETRYWDRTRGRPTKR
jgi:hypothetical protein